MAKSCDHCKMQIPNNATTCPYCQKDPDSKTRKEIENAVEGAEILGEKMKSLSFWILWLLFSLFWWVICLLNNWSNSTLLGIIFGLLTSVFIHEIFFSKNK